MDLYSKVVFTIIAFALAALALENVGATAVAQSTRPQKVIICDEDGQRCAEIVKPTGYGAAGFMTPSLATAITNH